MIHFSRPAVRPLLLASTLLAATACGGDADEQGQPTPRTASPTAQATAETTTSPSPRPSPSPEGSPGGEARGVISRESFGIPWSVEFTQRNGEWCATARAEGVSQEVCGDELSLNETQGGQEVVSVVELAVGTLDITAGLVVEGVSRVRVETAPPPENPDGPGAMEEVEPQDVLEGLNAYAEADQDPTQGAGDDLPIQRVVAFDRSGDRLAEVAPAS